MKEPVELKHLLSSHITWLVEWSVPARWAYVFLWFLALALLLPSRKFVFPPWGVAVAVAFFVALVFNASGKWWNWPLPLLWTGAALWARLKTGQGMGGNNLAAAAAAAACLIALSGLLPAHSSVSIRAYEGGRLVRVGRGAPILALLQPNPDVLGAFYGHDVRRGLAARESGSVWVVNAPPRNLRASAWASSCPEFVLSGMSADAFAREILPLMENARAAGRSEWLLINCGIEPGNWLEMRPRVRILRGRFFGDPFHAEWSKWAAEHPNVTIADIPGVGRYMAGWWPMTVPQ